MAGVMADGKSTVTGREGVRVTSAGSIILHFYSLCRDPILQLPGFLSRICCSDWLNGVTS